MTGYLQKILFGGPGVGKSHKITKILEELGIDNDSDNSINTVFHPEYTYGDFMGKLLPLTIEKKVEYKFYEGYFLKVLAKAYKNILLNPESPEPVALVIDEINRGNSSAIFGTVFQLLDREHDGENEGWSCYKTQLSEMEYFKLLELIGITYDYSSTYNIDDDDLREIITGSQTIARDNGKLHTRKFNEKILHPIKIKEKSIRIPPNMSIIATMNTSDNSIFYMDSAFKRRWDWEFIKGERQDATIDGKHDWSSFVDNLNKFFVYNSKFIRQIEDKQIGYWFIKAKNKNITTNEIKNKLLFFIWDSVFSRDKEGLKNLIGVTNELITFNQFSDQCENFIEKIITYQPK